MFGKIKYHALDPVAFALRRVLPGTSASFGPPRRQFVLRRDLPLHPEFVLREIYPSGRIRYANLGLSSTQQHEVDRQSAADDWTNEIHPGFVASVKNGRYISSGSLILTPSDDAYGAVQFPHDSYFSPKEHPAFRHASFGSCADYSGRCLLLLSFPNPYHFLFESVARIALAQEAGFPLSSFKFFVSDRSKNSFQREILAFLGVDEGRFIAPSLPPQHFRFSELVFSNATYGIPPKLCELLRRLLDNFRPTTPAIGLPKRIYLSRGSEYTNRRTLNETEVMKLLETRGFTKILPHLLSASEQRAIMENADVVVAAHSAALANLIWCRPGTRVIELRARDHVVGWWKLYWNLGSALDLDYHWVNCTSSAQASAVNPQYADLTVPIPDLDRALAQSGC